MNLIGIKNRSNKQWRLKMYSKLEKLGYKHKPSLSFGDYLIINPKKEFELVNKNKFDVFMFDNCIMFEARNEKEFFEKLNKI